MTTTSTGPLAGVRVLDLTRVIMGPYATQLLADQGADVIVVETPEGDINRLGAGPHQELSGISLNVMRNKRSVVLDLKSDEGRDALLRLAASCDVVVATMRPRALVRLGVDYAAIAKVRPDVIYCQAQGWPLASPEAEDPAYDEVIQAASGASDLAAMLGGEPGLLPTLLADKVSGVVMAQAITAAIFHRLKSGQGQHIEVPMVTATSSFLLVEHGAGAISEPPVDRPGYQRILTPERRPHRTLDGWVHVLPYLPKHYEALFSTAGRADLVGDPRYATRRATLANSDSLYRDVRAIAAEHTTEEILSRCREQGIPVTRVVTIEDLLADLPLAEHPHAGSYRVLPHPAIFSRTPAGSRRPAPLIGEHTGAVLAELDDAGGEMREAQEPTLKVLR